jgi:hypothetical protein
MVPLPQRHQLPAMFAHHCSEMADDGILARGSFPYLPG